MSDQYTQGPWYFNTKERSICKAEENGDIRIAQIDDISREDDANARLIAAAPELLRAAIAALTIVNNAYPYGSIASDLRAAIAKAEGRS